MIKVDSFNEFAERAQTLMKDTGIGILRFEKVDLEKLQFTLTNEIKQMYEYFNKLIENYSEVGKFKSFDMG